MEPGRPARTESVVPPGPARGMRITTFEELNAWDLSWPIGEAGPWELNRAGIQQALGGRRTAIGVYWIGYSQDGTHRSFLANYCGKAVGQPLFKRLGQHAPKSRNKFINQHLNPKNNEPMPKLWFRFVEFAGEERVELAELAEGTMIAGFKEEYKWNGRNEWKQHWAMEDEQTEPAS
jgi:hypothetical protein